jgi:hypothetical protein
VNSGCTILCLSDQPTQPKPQPATERAFSLERAMNFASLFSYDSELGILRNTSKRNSRAKAGTSVGWVSDSGYLITTINGKKFRVHRIIWELHNGQIPVGLEIDHINRDRLDNRIENLRLATRHEQNLNLSKRRSCSGVTGVVFNKKDARWQAQIGFKGRQIYLGQFDSKEMAIEVRKQAQTTLGFRGQTS